MTLFINGANGETVNIKDGVTVSEFLKTLDILPNHTKPLTLKSDGVVLGTNAKIPKDVMTLEVIERHDPDVVSDTEGDVVAPETVSPSPVSTGDTNPSR